MNLEFISWLVMVTIGLGVVVQGDRQLKQATDQMNAWVRRRDDQLNGIITDIECRLGVPHDGPGSSGSGGIAD